MISFEALGTVTFLHISYLVVLHNVGNNYDLMSLTGSHS